MDTYYNPADLANFSGDGIGSLSPELWDKFMAYYGSVFEDGALTAREKALIALAVAAAVQCPYCIDAYTNTCLQMGCDGAEIAEAFHVTNAIRGGAALAHGVQALKIIEDQELQASICPALPDGRGAPNRIGTVAASTCLQMGCDGAEIAEAFHVTNAIRGGAALAHGAQALKIIEDQEL